MPHLSYCFCEVTRPTVRKIVAIHGGNHDVVELHLRRHFGHLRRLFGIEKKFFFSRRPLRHRAKTAATGA